MIVIATPDIPPPPPPPSPLWKPEPVQTKACSKPARAKGSRVVSNSSPLPPPLLLLPSSPFRSPPSPRRELFVSFSFSRDCAPPPLRPLPPAFRGRGEGGRRRSSGGSCDNSDFLQRVSVNTLRLDRFVVITPLASYH